MKYVFTIDELKEMQGWSLDWKIKIAKEKIQEFYEAFDGNVYVSFSGGKDSMVLLDLVRQLYPDVPAVFSNTGLEYPEIRSFAKSKGAVVTHPKMSFVDVIKKYGYPLISKDIASAIYYARRIVPKGSESYPLARRLMLLGALPAKKGVNYEEYVSTVAKTRKQAKTTSIFNKSKWLPVARDMPFLISHYCCTATKKRPLQLYQRKNSQFPFIGTLAEESRSRREAWLRNGCNAFNSKHPMSQPLSFFTEQDILEYIHKNNLDICSVYGDVCVDDEGKYYCSGCQRTGCMFCGFGAHLDKKGHERFLMLKETHPKQYDYCINGGQWTDNPYYDPDASMEPDEIGWVNWNPKKIWTPSREGLGMGKVFNMLNEVYGKDFIVYK